MNDVQIQVSAESSSLSVVTRTTNAAQNADHIHESMLFTITVIPYAFLCRHAHAHTRTHARTHARTHSAIIGVEHEQ